MIAAITATTKRFGPSGSSKKKNIALEHTIAVIPKITKVNFFDLKYILVIILYQIFLGMWGCLSCGAHTIALREEVELSSKVGKLEFF